MKVIVGNRGTGKTHRMVQWFVEDPTNRVILVSNVSQKRFVVDDIIRYQPEMGERTRAWVGNIIAPSTWSAMRGRRVKEAWVDNVDLLLRDILGYSIPITMSSSEEMDVEEI